MTPGEAKAWIAATERSRTEWRLDEIHGTVDDALFYKGGTNGYFIKVRRLYADTRQKQPLNKWGVEVGTYEGAVPHIGEARFLILGRKAFETADRAFFFVGDKVPGTAILCERICPEAAPQQDEPRRLPEPPAAERRRPDPHYLPPGPEDEYDPEDDAERQQAWLDDPERRALSGVPPYRDGEPTMPRGWFEREWPR